VERITSFSGKNRFLSNFYSCTFIYRGVTWQSSEHAYQAAKTDDPTQKRVIRLAQTPGMAKRLGKNITLTENWDELEILVMYNILQEKFGQNIQLRRMLIHTGDKKLIEGNNWHDNFWGDCRCDKCKDIRGKNILGRLLMRVRRELNDG